MRWVSNTSVISNLAVIGELELLRAECGRVSIPAQVKAELMRLTHAKGKRTVEDSMNEGWLEVIGVDATEYETITEWLHEGESAAIALALRLGADRLLIDEAAGREEAESLGIRCIGLLGILLQAKRNGRLAQVRPVIEKLRTEARFFISRKIEAEVLKVAGE
jgi:predicted nucleic acid-binding protein